MLAYNNLPLTQAALASVFAQDVGPLEVNVVDNGSTDGTLDWLEQTSAFMRGVSEQNELNVYHYDSNRSPVAVCNELCAEIFDCYDYALLAANDVILPPNAYRLMLQWPRGIVTASMSDRKDYAHFDVATAVSENTPMCVMLVRNWAHEALIEHSGHFFDPGYFHYASDCDMALRLASCGIRGVQLDLQYYHAGSASLGSNGHVQANKDRDHFFRKWGFAVDSERYAQMATDINFKGRDANSALALCHPLTKEPVCQ
jgi:GT2 family glycosyltransferase